MAFYTRRRQFRAPGKLIEMKSLEQKKKKKKVATRSGFITLMKKGITEKISLMRFTKS